MRLKFFNNRPAAGDDETYEYFHTIPDGTVIELKAIEQSTGSVPMLRTWRGWMGEMAAYMAGQGCTMPLYVMDGKNVGSREFKADDAHDLFTSRFLGVDESGKRYSWSMTKKPDCAVAPKSSRLYAMDKMLTYATERGIKLTIPRKSEFSELMEEQER